jgi:hypothetical protein
MAERRAFFVSASNLRLSASIVGMALAGLTTGCHNADTRGRAPLASAQASMLADDTQTLDDCSPFASLDGRRLVTFDEETRKVAEGYGPADPGAQSDLAAALDDVIESRGSGPGSLAFSEEIARWRIVTGTYRVDRGPRTVLLRFPDRAESYALFTPMPLQQDGCLLVVGAPIAAQLDRSLFGVPASQPPLDHDE